MNRRSFLETIGLALISAGSFLDGAVGLMSRIGGAPAAPEPLPDFDFDVDAIHFVINKPVDLSFFDVEAYLDGEHVPYATNGHAGEDGWVEAYMIGSDGLPVLDAFTMDIPVNGCAKTQAKYLKATRRGRVELRYIDGPRAGQTFRPPAV
jgi:hypothetical protein